MSQKILVTYASRSGATAGVAEAIGKTLAEQGAEVDILPVHEIQDLAPYQAVVAGSAIQNKQWLPEAMQFLQANRSEIRQKPFAMFSVCMTLAMRNARNPLWSKYLGHDKKPAMGDKPDNLSLFV